MNLPHGAEPIDPHSRAARTIVGFYGLVEHWAPTGSRRRAAYRMAVAGVVRAAAHLRPSARSVEHAVPELPCSPAPVVCVAVLHDGDVGELRRCLASIARHPVERSSEVVVLALSPVAPETLGCRVIEVDGSGLDESVLASLATMTDAPLAIVLSSRVEVRPGGLDRIVDALALPEAHTLVAPSLTAPDGRVVEAGGVVLPDGRKATWPSDGEILQDPFAYDRPVDFCSSIAFGIRLSGVGDVVIRDGVVALAADRDFVSGGLWHVCRAEYTVPAGPDGSTGRPESREDTAVELRRRTSQSWIVVVDARVPRPDADAGSVRLLQLLLTLRSEGFGVLFVPNDRDPAGPYGSALTSRGIEVLSGPVDLHRRLAAMGEMVVGAVVARATVAWPYLLMIRRALPRVPVYFDTVDLHFLREERADAVAGQEAASPVSRAMRELELGLVRAADRTLVVSPVERKMLTDLVPSADVRVLSLVQPVFPAVQGSPGRSGILFVGSFDHPPNVDGLAWLLTDVLGQIRSSNPSTVVTVVGLDPPAHLIELADESVLFLGRVPDLEPVYASTRVVVAPLRFGAGVKGKIVEAMAHGVPVVTTQVGAEGMPLEHGETAWIARDATHFAEGVTKLLEEDVLWARLAVQGRSSAEEHYGQEAFVAAARAHAVPGPIPDQRPATSVPLPVPDFSRSPS